MNFLAPVLPTIIVFVAIKNKWVKTIAAIIWFAGCIISGVNSGLYLIATAMFLPVIYGVVWLIKYIRRKRS